VSGRAQSLTNGIMAQDLLSPSLIADYGHEPPVRGGSCLFVSREALNQRIAPVTIVRARSYAKESSIQRV
jgi:hypothetical protein